MDQPMPFPPEPRYPVRKREAIFGAALLVCCIFLWNCILYGGFHLGFAIGYLAVMGCCVWYLLSCGHRFDGYSGSLLGLSAAIAAGFARSSDGFVKFVLLCFLLFASNLSFCLAAKQNRRAAGGIGSVLDAPRAFFVLGIGGMSATVRGLNDARKNAGTAGKKGSAALLGIVIAIPVIAVVVFLLMRADAAFEGLMDLLPGTDWDEPITSLLVGAFACWILFSRGLGLHFSEKQPTKAGRFHGIHPITVNILMGSVCLVYVVYLLSQLAYFSGGLSGILPEEYTMAQYARRGFFEMAWLGAINLGLICFSMGLVEKNRSPGLTKGFCLFLGLVTLFLITTASAKMFLYIGSYGLTRLRVLTQVIMVWLAITTVLVCIWLFRPGFAYMKAVILSALVLGAAVLWADVDTQVARYNVRAYQSGVLETVDVYHLRTLGCGAVPYIEELTHDADPQIAEEAKECLKYRSIAVDDFRYWNWSRVIAAEVLKHYEVSEAAELLP